MNGTPDFNTTQEPRPPEAAAPGPQIAWIKTRDPQAKSPALGAFLSVMPGLGQVYVGYYRRGFIHCLVVASVITFLASETVVPLQPLAGLFLAFFWLYNIVDAARRAALYNHYLAGRAEIELPDDGGFHLGGSLAGGPILIVIGTVLLLHTRWAVPLDWLEQWWPAAPILVGVYLVARALYDRRNTAAA